MIALVLMRLTAFVRGGRAIAPVITALVVLGLIHGGGQSSAGSAYGYSAAMLFPVLAWQAKLLLDTEPDVQRQLARLTVGARREAVAGILAALAVGLAFCLVAMLAPWWPLHAIRGPVHPGLEWGLLAHLLALAAGVALGALASRPVTRTIRTGTTVLVTGSVLAVVLGLSGSVAPWLAPPVMATARALATEQLPSAGTFWLLTARTVLWCAVMLGLYARLRRSRA